MTAIPTGRDPVVLLLICDSCGRDFDPGDRRQEWIVLWQRAVAAGWDGRDRAIGPHRCDRCAEQDRAR
ncbi:hypothetical protein Q5530_13480 [Saccharothrix sp. BKS2]|uniref:hypothetical protein n=1 Tax=Saccharothrix sp. BKS2 TaxID=3064400 RepID=UPI0039E7F378